MILQSQKSMRHMHNFNNSCDSLAVNSFAPVELATRLSVFGTNVDLFHRPPRSLIVHLLTTHLSAQPPS